MAVLAKVATQKVSLNELLQHSLTVQSLSEEERQKFIEHVKALPKDKQREVADVLLNEANQLNKIEETLIPERKAILEKYTKDMNEAKKKCIRLLQQKIEEKERKKETQTEKNILKKLDDSH
ncbi:hypothetical protein HYV57_05505 [Candidatus Peregrinibacteria bacterium]|nr:hypothetical protein [Candidatus Peregrinibacteria bacterium]